MAYHYNTYREELAKAYPGFGYALWEPDPGEQNPPVGVGDVGFFREGRFHRLFNALLPADHPSHESFGVPEHHKPLLPSTPNHINRGSLAPNTLYSYGVTIVSGGFGILATTEAGSAEVSFSFTKKHGAVLSFPAIARREDTVSRYHFRDWILKHIDTWLAFTQMHGLGIEMEDIVLVTGCHRTRSWTNIAFNEVQAGAQLSLKVEVAGLGANINWGVSNVRIQGTVHNQGPSGENLPENQCIFVRGFRVKRILRIIPWLKAAAEPKPDPRGKDREPEKEVVPIPGATQFRDPLHILLERIAEEAPDCDVVLVHDDDLERIRGASYGVSLEPHRPEEIADYLRKSHLEIGVMPDPSTANDGGSRTLRSHRTVAMLSEQLSSLDRTFPETMTDHPFSEPELATKLRVRVLIMGRANSGKTSILQRLCDTTDSPIIYRGNDVVKLDPSIDRGVHDIEDELVFSNLDGFIFHDSRGIESGSTEELEILQEFIRQKSGKRRLEDRLHAIWCCISMDNHRPELEMKTYNDICLDRNVPVITVFTKYDLFLRNVRMDLEDYGNPGDNISDEAERLFREHYLCHLGGGARFVRLEKTHKPETRCDDLLEETARALEDVAPLVPWPVQRTLDANLVFNRSKYPSSSPEHSSKIPWERSNIKRDERVM